MQKTLFKNEHKRLYDRIETVETNCVICGAPVTAEYGELCTEGIKPHWNSIGFNDPCDCHPSTQQYIRMMDRAEKDLETIK